MRMNINSMHNNNRLIYLVISLCVALLFLLPYHANAENPIQCTTQCVEFDSESSDYENCCFCTDYCQPPPPFMEFEECYDRCMTPGGNNNNTSSGNNNPTCECETDSDCLSGEECYIGICYLDNEPAEICLGSGSGSGSGGGSGGSGGSGSSSGLGNTSSGNSSGASSGSSGNSGTSGSSGSNNGSSGSSGGSGSSGSSGGSSGASSGSESGNNGGYCEESQTQCASKLNDLWQCAFIKCGTLYLWCNEAHAPCQNELAAANNCIYQTCNTDSSSTGGGGPFVGFTNIPYQKNLYSALADTPPNGQTAPPLEIPYDPFFKSGANGGETMTDMKAEFLDHPYAKGGPSDWRVAAPFEFRKNLADRMIKPCFYGKGGQAAKDYYDNEVLGRLQAIPTTRVEPGSNTLTAVPIINDCSWILQRAGF